MQININDMTIDWEFKKASKYLPVRLSTTYFDGIGEWIHYFYRKGRLQEQLQCSEERVLPRAKRI